MSEAFNRAPEPDTSRAPRRDGQSQAPQVAPHVARVVNENPALARAIEAQQSKPAPEPERPPDPAAELIKPLTEMPKWESEKLFRLSAPVRSSNGATVTEVRMRAPVGADIFEVGGLPTKTQWTPGGMNVDMDIDRMKRWFSRLAIDADMTVLNRAPARDVRGIYEWLIGELNQAGN